MSQPNANELVSEALGRLRDDDAGSREDAIHLLCAALELDPETFEDAGCLPDGDPIGPFTTEKEALLDAQEEA